MLYNNLSGYLREFYGKRLKKICIDGGFSCPNRDGKCGTGGCIYCGERGAGEHIDAALSISEQVERVLKTAKEDENFIAYFQNFSNTYADVKTLKSRYDAALTDGRIKVLSIGTRPDCLDEEKVRLLAEYNKKYDVWVELGLQSASDETAVKINRGYMKDVFENAVNLLKKYGIKTVAHMIIGLPGENADDIINTAKYISSLGIWGVKIHSIYVMAGTRLADMYNAGLYSPPSLSEYCDAAAKAIGHISENMIIHRITGDCPKDLLIAPEWNKNKNEIIKAINDKMKKIGVRQGSLL